MERALRRDYPYPATRHPANNVSTPNLPDVYSLDEVARAAGVPAVEVRALEAAGFVRAIVPHGYFTAGDAVTAIRALTASGSERPLFRPAVVGRRRPGMPIALSGTLHVGLLAVVALMTSLSVAGTQARIDDRQDLHMVFLVAPGPGGGGGGGGLKAPTPAPPAERKGVEKMRSPVAVHHPPPPILAARRTPPPRIDPPPMVRPQEPPPPVKAEAIPAVFAPVVPSAPDPRDRAGSTAHPVESADSHGIGTGGGVGNGQGTGIGDGDGSGIGPGSGGGTGGGPYRPGTGITPPSIQREVRPDYTDEGRRRGIAGDVVVEIVVRADGSVGTVKLLQGLGAGLDQRAVDAVRQWKFNPAKRYGMPVDVIVEVAVEFKLR
jgi:TonB family protein